MLHRELVHVGGDGDLLLALVAELDVLTEHVDDVAEDELFGSEHGADILARKHIDMLLHVRSQVELIAVGADQRIERAALVGQYLHIRHAVDAVVAHRVVFDVIADQVVLALLRDQLIGVDLIFAHGAVRVAALMELLVRAVFEVAELHPAAPRDRLVEQFDIVEKLFVVGLILRHTGDVPHARLEVDIGEGRELLDQLLVLLIGNVVGEQDAVDKQAQLAVGELALEVEVGEDHVLLLVAVLVAEHADTLAVIDVVAELDQVHQVALDSLAVELHVILAIEDLLYLLLAQTMILVRVAFEDVEDIHDRQLLRLLGVHHMISALCSDSFSLALIK